MTDAPDHIDTALYFVARISRTRDEGERVLHVAVRAKKMTAARRTLAMAAKVTERLLEMGDIVDVLEGWEASIVKA
jgi:hypothetical protein